MDEDELLQQQQIEEAWRQVEAEEQEWTNSVLTNVEISESDASSSQDSLNKLDRTHVVVLVGSELNNLSLLKDSITEVWHGVKVKRYGQVYFINRNAPNSHPVDHKLIWKIIYELSPKFVIGVDSVKSLRPDSVPVGSILSPTDWLEPSLSPLSLHDQNVNDVPVLDESTREFILACILKNADCRKCVLSAETEVVYCQSRGRRSETRAEVRMIRNYANVVGKTSGDEATLANESGIPYAMLCVVAQAASGLSTYKQQSNVEQLLSKAVMAVVSSLQMTSMWRQPSQYTVDTLIRARYVCTVDVSDTCISHGLVAIRDGAIVGVHSASDSTGIPPYEPKEILDYPDSMLMPGLINAHTHAAMALMRGFGDDLKLTDWLVTKIWPAEAKCVSEEYVRDGTRLAIEEMLASGTTCMQDVYFFPSVIEEVCNHLGMRGVVGMVVLEFPSPMAKDGEAYIQLIRDKLSQNKQKNESGLVSGAPPLVTFAVTPHAPYSVSEAHIVESKALAAQYGCVFHTHLHECEEEIDASVKLDRKSGFCHQCDVACRPLANLHRIGILDSTCSFAHMTQLTEEEMDLISQHKCHVVHCPSSNMKLASGFCPVAKLMEKGVNVALGTDGAASNNSLDMVGEIKLAALLGKGVAKSATAVNAKQAMRMATINGAQALGLEKVCGSLEVGKRADMIVVDLLNRNACRPVFDPVATFVYSATRDCIRSVFVDGDAKILDGVRVRPPTYAIETELRKCAERWQAKMEDVVRELQE